jgi:hypothetical protein
MTNIEVLKETLDRIEQSSAEQNNTAVNRYVDELDALQRPLSPVIPETASCER